MVTKLKNSNDDNKKKKLWHISKNQIVTKTKTLKWEKTPKFKAWQNQNFEKTQKHKLWQTSTTCIVKKLKNSKPQCEIKSNSNCDQT